MTNTQIYNLIAGQAPAQPPALAFPGAKKILGIIVDCASADISVQVFGGYGPQAGPAIVTVQPGAIVGTPIDGYSAIYLVFGGVPAANGTIRVILSDQPVAVADSNQVTAVIPGPITIAGTVPVSVAAAIAISSIGGTVTVAPSGGAMPISASAAIPVSGRVGIAGTVPVSVAAAIAVSSVGGTVAISAAADLPIKTGSGGAIQVDGSAVTQPISGTVGVAGTVPVSIAAAIAISSIAGTVTVAPSGGTMPISAAADLPIKTGSGGAIKVDGSAVTQPISAAAAIPVSGTVGISGTVPVSIAAAIAISSVAGTVTVAPSGGTMPVSGAVAVSGAVGKTSDFPVGATSIFSSTDCAFTSATTFVDLMTTLLSPGQNFYLTQLSIFGFKPTPLWWQIQWENATSSYTTVMTGSEDGSFSFDPPIMLAQGTVAHAQLRVVVLGTIIGTVNAEVFANGYYV